jgi:hypothetical protein
MIRAGRADLVPGKKSWDGSFWDPDPPYGIDGGLARIVHSFLARPGSPATLTSTIITASCQQIKGTSVLRSAAGV